MLSACGSGDDDSSAASSGSDTSAGCATDTTAGKPGVNLLPIPPAQVVVSDKGSGPAQVLAAEPDRRTPQRVTLVTTSSVASAGARDAQTVELPLTAQMHCTDNTDLEMTLGRATSPDVVLDDQLRPVDGSAAGLAIGPGSSPISLRLIPAAEAGSEARSAIEQSLVQSLQKSVALPTEPIAPGARWQIRRTISSAATVVQTIDATLRSVADGRAQIDISVDEEPVDSVFSIPGTNKTLTISRYSMSGTGSVTVDLARVLPVAGELRMDGARELVGADANQPLIQQTGFSMTWR
ncbi:hypothetical protein GS4_30_00880 [Gordonia soli NBRC 108243]|uniref:Uncharacterized protein n=2 Tax=Gordonia soli TaxID=320799 RepID=M0QP15_9ACTN|nr:hypothetical protein GS4_30_00880 [Gordonia soli NBRC 108243]